MKTIAFLRPLLRLVGRLFVLPLAGLLAHATPTTTQSITLNPGWNAVHFEVLPANADLDFVFDGVPLDSVWAYGNGLGTPDFIQEVTEQSLAKAGWFSWVPTNRVDAFQNNLFQVQVNRSYLIKYTGATATTLTFAGTPTTRTQPWLPDAFNFRGLPVDPAIPPTFDTFFSPSPAHYPSGALGLIYRLDSAGVWQRVAKTDQVHRGEAYWIYCKGGSSYVAPFVASPEIGDGLDFGVGIDELTLSLQNSGTADRMVTVTDLGAPVANPLSYAQRQPPDLILTWPAVPSPWVQTVAAGSTLSVRIAPRRADLTDDLFETVLEVTDGLGSRFLFPVSVGRVPAVVATANPTKGKARPAGIQTAAIPEAITHAGLWVGTAIVNAVSEAHSGPLTTNVVMGFTLDYETNAASGLVTTVQIPNSVTRTSPSMAPTPTGSPFSLRLLVHVDGTGEARLLKEVIEMWKDGVTTKDAGGNVTVVTPGHYVLLTDDKLIGQFTGVANRDGVSVGRRLSTAGFDFADDELPLSGDFAIGSSVVGTNTLSDTFAGNPFKHRYHPDHQTGFKIRRVIGLDFSAAPTNAPPGYGERVLDGIYHETVTGLHRTNIVVSGTFRLTRISATAVLNQ